MSAMQSRLEELKLHQYNAASSDLSSGSISSSLQQHALHCIANKCILHVAVAAIHSQSSGTGRGWGGREDGGGGGGEGRCVEKEGKHARKGAIERAPWLTIITSVKASRAQGTAPIASMVQMLLLC